MNETLEDLITKPSKVPRCRVNIKNQLSIECLCISNGHMDSDIKIAQKY